MSTTICTDPGVFLQGPPGHVHLCMGAYGEHSSRLGNFEGFKLVTNLKETKEANCNIPLNIITSQYRYQLRVELGDWDGNMISANYQMFRVGTPAERYKLGVDGYTGNAVRWFGSSRAAARDRYSKTPTAGDWAAPPNQRRVSSMSRKASVDTAANRKVGSAGKPNGSVPVSKHNTNASSSVSSGLSSNDQSNKYTKNDSKTYVDNAFNRRHERVGLPHGSKVVSKNAKKETNPSARPKEDTASAEERKNSAGESKAQNENIDNSFSKVHEMVEWTRGCKVISKKQTTGSHKVDMSNADTKAYMEESKAIIEESRSHAEKGCLANEQVQCYKDNPRNRRLERVGMPYGTMVFSRASPTTISAQYYVDNPRNRRLKRVGKPRGSQPASRLSEKTRRMKEFIEKIQQNEEDFDTDGTRYVDVQDNDDDDNDATDQAIMHCNRKLEELRWYDESKSDEIPGTSKSLMDDFTGQQIAFAEINLGKRIGKGGFGDVYFASWKGKVVAVKRLRTQSVSKERLREFTDEVFKFCDLDHPNIVKFIGACVKTPNLAIVMEYMRMSIFDALYVENDSIDFSEAEQLSIFRQTTSGLLYLHERNMAHCDLKTQNVLLNYAQPPDGYVMVKITDFGLSLIKSLRDEEFVRNVGTPRYSAPEVLRGEILSADGMMKADIYSFGLVIYEVIFEQEPFYNLTTHDQLQKQVGEAGLTPDIPDCMKIDRKLEQLMKSSWSFDPSRRPEVKELLETLEMTVRIYSLD